MNTVTRALSCAALAVGCLIAGPLAAQPSTPLERLAAGDIAAIETTYSTLQRRFRDGQASEVDLLQAYTAFYQSQDRYRAALDSWIAAYPRSASAYTARGVYLRRLGDARRGRGYSNTVTSDNAQYMRDMHAQAGADLTRALELDPEAYIAALHLLNISMFAGDRVAATRHLELGNRILPSNLLVRARYLISLTPKWGGSWREMEAFVARCEAEGVPSPRIRQLRAIMFKERGDAAAQAGNVAAARVAYRQALELSNEEDAWFRGYYLQSAQTYFGWTSQAETSAKPDIAAFVVLMMLAAAALYVWIKGLEWEWAALLGSGALMALAAISQNAAARGVEQAVTVAALLLAFIALARIVIRNRRRVALLSKLLDQKRAPASTVNSAIVMASYGRYEKALSVLRVVLAQYPERDDVQRAIAVIGGWIRPPRAKAGMWPVILARTNPTSRQSIAVIILAGFAFVALIVGLPEIVARLYPEHESWARDRIPKLVPVLGLLLLLAVGALTNSGFKRYAPGDDPLAMARFMDAFGSRRKAIRYLESVPRDHPRSQEVQIQLARLRQQA